MTRHHRHRRPASCCGRGAIIILFFSGGGGHHRSIIEALPRNDKAVDHRHHHRDSNSLNLSASRLGGGGAGANSDGGRGNRQGHHGRRHGRPFDDGSGCRSSASAVVALRDSFPCESDRERRRGADTAVSSGNNGDAAVSSSTASETAAAATPAASATNYLNANSFAAQNNIEGGTSSTPSTVPAVPGTNISSFSLNARGGEISDVIMPSKNDGLDDDELDRMVDDLIAGLDEESDTGMIQNDEESEIDDNDETEDDSEWEDEDDEMNANIEQEDEEGIVSKEDVDKANTDADPASEPFEEDGSASNHLGGQSSSSRRPLGRHPRNSLSTIPITPTNAYYRFLVRRGPKGHILASFTLLAVQWIHTYIPYIYQSIAAVLLKLRIYNPQVLYERERQRQMEMRYGPRKKAGFTSKLFGTSKGKSSQALQQKAMQKQADEEAATKLKQLYKTMKMGSGMSMLSEVKYRYLSVGFRKRHGLGKQYRTEKPRTFMGEVVEGSIGGNMSGSASGLDEGLMGVEDIVFSEEEKMEGKFSGQDSAEGAQPKKLQKGRQHRSGVKRKKISDWVVKAFVTSHHPKSPLTGTAKVESSLWTEVERGAILAAAWDSRAAEQMATAAGQGSRKGGAKGRDKRDSKTGAEPVSDRQDVGDMPGAASINNGSGYGASKMFQSVMTRVGSNGRIFGAYPNDAPPIEECAHERGVIQLARRYGYGDWGANDGKNDAIYDDEDDLMIESDVESEGGSWGGGDLIFGGDTNIDLPSSSPKGGRGKSLPKKKKRSTSDSRMHGSEKAAVAKARRRKRSSKSNKRDVLLGLSGGGTAGDTSKGKSRLTFEVGINTSSVTSPRRKMKKQRPINYENATHLARETLSMSQSNRRDLTRIKSQLQDRKSSPLLLSAETKIKAPMQLLNKSKGRLDEHNDK